MDGEKFQYVSGSFHYFRAFPETWRTKLRTMRAAGLNAVDTYIYWGLHNPHDGEYKWDGIADIKQFVEIAQEEGLYVILRPGPYICAELDNVSKYIAVISINFAIFSYREVYHIGYSRNIQISGLEVVILVTRRRWEYSWMR